MSHRTESKVSFLPLLILVYFFSNVYSFAQTSNGIEKDLSQSKMKDRAVHSMKTGDVYSALFYYELIVKNDTNDLDALYQLAEMYRFSRNYTKADTVYSKVISKAPSKYPFALYYKGLMQKMCGKYEEAKANMLLFKTNMGKTGDKEFIALLNKEIAGCDSGIVYREFPNNVKVGNIGNSVNHPHTEFSPLLLDSTTMLFGSLRMDSVMFYDAYDDQFEKTPVRQIYKAEKNDTVWEEKGKYEVFNDPNIDMGNFVYSALSGKYYFSKCAKDAKGRVTCKIYSIEKIDGQWASPVLLPAPVNIEGYTSTQPALMYDTTTTVVTPVKKGPEKHQKSVKKPTTANTASKPVQKSVPVEYLYFVSDRPRGKGGLDIWYTSYSSTRKVWSNPVNFSAINTSVIECTPYFHVPTQTFYFSSNGNTTSGGLDIYKTKKTEKGFSKPLNLGFPINSPQDDLGLTLTQDGQSGFIVSNRPGGTPYFHETCCDDIYSFEIIPPKPFMCKLSLTIVESDTTGCMPDQKMNIISYDVNRKDSVKTDTVNVVDCKYEMSLAKEWVYKFSINREGYLKDTLTIETRDMCAAEIIEKKLIMNKEKKEIPVVNVVPEEGKTFVLKDIQYDFDQASLTPIAMAALDSVILPFLSAYPNDKLMIHSHTDNQGSHKYNHILSQKRAESVVKYLVSKGVDPARLHPKGNGETKPIEPNQNPDGSDNPMGRAINRRTEFLLLKEEQKEK